MKTHRLYINMTLLHFKASRGQNCGFNLFQRNFEHHHHHLQQQQQQQPPQLSFDIYRLCHTVDLWILSMKTTAVPC